MQYSKVLLLAVSLLVCWLAGAPAKAWDPENGDWSKTRSTDLRVMTWNVHDTIRAGNDKQEAIGDWPALAHILAGVKPDVLLLQETGDYGVYGQVDTVTELEMTIQMLFEGGYDTFNGGVEITSWVQKYAPDYNLPYVFASTSTDGYNRNVIVSRFPFTDLNGDGVGELSDLPRLLAHLYQTGGTGGGTRGFMFGEMDVPDETYRGDLVTGNAHLKAYSEGAAERLAVSQRVAYYIDYFYNGGGFGVSDYYGKILGASAASILQDCTPIVIGGDWNEDEQSNGRRGPADWMTQAEYLGGTDGTDRDRSDATYDAALHPFTSSRATYASSKLDYLAWQDSIATERLSFVFNTVGIPTQSLPPEVASYARPSSASGNASDHLPVIVDLILPIWGDADGDGDVELDDHAAFSACLVGPGGEVLSGCEMFDFDDDGDVDLSDFSGLQGVFGL